MAGYIPKWFTRPQTGKPKHSVSSAIFSDTDALTLVKNSTHVTSVINLLVNIVISRDINTFTPVVNHTAVMYVAKH